MRKHRIERNLAFPSEEFRAKVRTAAKQRGFRSEQAFLIAACEHELERGDNTEAMDDLEARILATLANVAKEVQALFTLVHTQVALTNCLLQYVLTCVAEPPEEVLPTSRARAKLRYAKILRLAGQEVATRNKATPGRGADLWQTAMRDHPSASSPVGQSEIRTTILGGMPESSDRCFASLR